MAGSDAFTTHLEAAIAALDATSDGSWAELDEAEQIEAMYS